jgi:low affinity Fe/Cu permease
VRSGRQGIELLLVAALLAAVLGAGVGPAINGSADFRFVLSIAVLVILFLLHRSQRRNNQAIEKTLDELIVLRNERQRRCPEKR